MDSQSYTSNEYRQPVNIPIESDPKPSLSSDTYIYTARDNLLHLEELIPLHTEPLVLSTLGQLPPPAPEELPCSLHPISPHKFIYTSLESLTKDGRLLTLHPAPKDDTIVCDLDQVKVADMEYLSFQALSYVWGSDKYNRVIRLNGAIKHVRQNLWSALQHLSLPGKARCLWVDALCIDQESLIERNCQVRQMSEIYSRAKVVLIWLGPSGDFSDMAFDFMRSLQKAAEGEKVGRFHDSRIVSDFYKTWVLSGGMCLFWSALKKLCLRNYWERLWIIQEIGLARHIEVHCGSDQISGDVFYGIIQRVKYSWSKMRTDDIFETSRKEKGGSQLSDREWKLLEQTLFQITNSFPNALFRISRARKGRVPLGELYFLAKDSVCFDPRDKVFGLLGLASNASLTVDYSTTLFDLFQAVMLESRDIGDRQYTDLVLARDLQHSFAKSLRDKTYAQIKEIRDMFDLPLAEGTELFQINGHLVGCIAGLESAWTNGEIGNPAPDSPAWLQDVTTSAAERLHHRLGMRDGSIYEVLQSELDLVQPIDSPASNGKGVIKEGREARYSRNPAHAATAQSYRKQWDRRKMIIRNNKESGLHMKIFRLDIVSDFYPGNYARAVIEHPQGLVPSNTSLYDLICAIDIPTIDRRVTLKDTVHVVLRCHGDGYSIVGRALLPPYSTDIPTTDTVTLRVTSSVLQHITA